MSKRITVTLTRDELWDMIAKGFDKADTMTCEEDWEVAGTEPIEYYSIVTDHLFEEMENKMMVKVWQSGISGGVIAK